MQFHLVDHCVCQQKEALLLPACEQPARKARLAPLCLPPGSSDAICESLPLEPMRLTTQSVRRSFAMSTSFQTTRAMQGWNGHEFEESKMFLCEPCKNAIRGMGEIDGSSSIPLDDD